MNNEKIKDPAVRHAIALAINRQAIQRARGGDLFGSITDSIIPPTVEGFVAPDLGLKPQGDPDAAKKLLVGKSVPALHQAIKKDTGTVDRITATVIQNSLKDVGIDMVIDSYGDDEYAAVFATDDTPEIDYYGWCADWATPSAVVPAVFGPDPEGQKWGSNNMEKYFDTATAKQIQDLMSSAESAPVVATKMAELANKIQTTAWPLLPTTLNNSPEVVGANVTNAGISPLLGVVDLNTVAVKS
jgi:peptide/nickel transport system substrate-binding protein